MNIEAAPIQCNDVIKDVNYNTYQNLVVLSLMGNMTEFKTDKVIT